MTEEIRQLVEELIAQRISQHRHDDLGSLRLSGKDMDKAPQTALTASSGGSAGAVYDATAQNLINNHTTRINQLESRLQNLGLIN